MLSEAGIRHIVCVASEYGEEVMSTNEYAAVHTGRMDSAQMLEYTEKNGFAAGDVIVDATHPYAALASANIQTMARDVHLTVYKVAREQTMTENARIYASMAEFAGVMEGGAGNILLTTGTNTLEEYCRAVSPETLGRTYVRVLPAAESIDICRGLGIASGHIIAMQGPFTYEMNKAVIMQYDIRHMLTKDSGAAGGYNEKISAAEDLGVNIHVLARPDEVSGYGIFEVYEQITGKRYAGGLKIIIAGAGMGSRALETAQTAEAIANADAVFGAKRLLEGISARNKYEMYDAGEIARVLDANRDIRTAVVMYSGDTGLYSGAAPGYEKLCKLYPDAEISVLPGISSVSYLASKLGTGYDDAAVTSVHGRNTEADIQRLTGVIRHNRKTFTLVSDSSDIRAVCRILADGGVDVSVTIGRNLSYASEQIMTLSCREAADYDADGIITVLFINEHPQKRRIYAAKSDDEFIRERTPMTKECIRHESILRLDLREGDRVYDIGGGTGSVAIEIAGLSDTLDVTTIERDPSAVALIRKNIEKHGLHNIKIIEEDAADAIKTLAGPDCVFIGGSGGDLARIMDELSRKGSTIRYVVNAVSLETVSEIMRITDEMNVSDRRIVQIAVSDVRTVGKHHMMQAQNPVTIFSFTL